jgi:flavin-dependent dehydrogenase
LPDQSRVVCFHALPDTARRALREPGYWMHLLATSMHVGPLVCDAEPLTRRIGREACGATLTRHGGPGWLAIGDAAMSFDPLASQGLFHALATGLAGARAVDAALDHDPQPGLAYGRMIAEVRRRYLAHCRYFYAQERRWPDAPFWASR